MGPPALGVSAPDVGVVGVSGPDVEVAAPLEQAFYLLAADFFGLPTADILLLRLDVVGTLQSDDELGAADSAYLLAFLVVEVAVEVLDAPQPRFAAVVFSVALESLRRTFGLSASVDFRVLVAAKILDAVEILPVDAHDLRRAPGYYDLR